MVLGVNDEISTSDETNETVDGQKPILDTLHTELIQEAAKYLSDSDKKN